MNKNVTKKVVLITGCSSGFGLLIAIAMAKAGFYVFASMRNLGKRAELESAAIKANVSIDIIELDVTKEDSIASAIAEIQRKVGPVDILVNNAGFRVRGFAEDVAINDLQQQIDTNFFGVVNMTKAVIPSMRERHSGHIINISSLSGLLATLGSSAYCASKFAVEGYMEALRYEGMLDGYYVTNIEPGFYRTAASSQWDDELDPTSPHFQMTQKLFKFYENKFKQAADPQAVADLVVKVAMYKNPRFRYVIGKEKIYLWLKNHLPESVFEKILMKTMKKVLR